jgi:rhodanese-related sulfurtransferase
MRYILTALFFTTALFAINPQQLPIVGVKAIHNDGTKIQNFVIERKAPKECLKIPIDEEYIWGKEKSNISDKCKETFVNTAGKIMPMSIHKDIKTVGELDVLEFINQKLSQDPEQYALVDSRKEGWYNQMTIPGAINVPYTDLDYDVDLAEFYFAALEKLGIKKIETGYDFSNAKTMIMFCNGIWCGQSPKAIKKLLSMGYPPKKIMWYRGGVQSWKGVGLTTTRQ